MLKTHRSVIVSFALVLATLTGAAQAEIVNFVFTSDPHYGITRTFNGTTGVSAQFVNEAMLGKMAALQGSALPNDGKPGAGTTLNYNFMVVTGDFANRNESGAPVATTSWNQFKQDYITAKPLGNIPVYLTPGNHDVSNAIGLKGKVGTIDNAALAGVYNNNIGSGADSNFLKGFTSYQAGRDQLNYQVSIAGGKINLMFVNMWPDKATRDGWMASNLSSTTPTLLFTHDQPAVESKHFTTTTPTGQSSYEGLITSINGGAPTNIVGGVATDEVKALANYLNANPEIKGYFHGNSNETQFYTMSDIGLSGVTGSTEIFRVDSPMKGNLSAGNDQLLSFQVVSIDTSKGEMVSREFLWNVGTNGVWGVSSPVVTNVPEPATMSLLLLGAGALIARRRHHAA